MGQVGQASKTLGSTEPVLRTGNQTWLGDPAIANLWRFLAGKIAELQNITNVSDVFFSISMFDGYTRGYYYYSCPTLG